VSNIFFKKYIKKGKVGIVLHREYYGAWALAQPKEEQLPRMFDERIVKCVLSGISGEELKEKLKNWGYDLSRIPDNVFNELGVVFVKKGEKIVINSLMGWEDFDTHQGFLKLAVEVGKEAPGFEYYYNEEGKIGIVLHQNSGGCWATAYPEEERLARMFDKRIVECVLAHIPVKQFKKKLLNWGYDLSYILDEVFNELEVVFVEKGEKIVIVCEAGKEGFITEEEFLKNAIKV
jgi:hypothetical protein